MRSYVAIFVTVACLCFGQQIQPELSQTFRSETALTLVPFNVIRDAYFVTEVKPEDVVLLEDRKPRPFTVFEGPGTGRRPPLELILLFDTTTLPPPESINKLKAPGASRVLFPVRWDRQRTYEFTSHWGESESRALLEKNGADVRVSVYSYDHQVLQLLCRSARDPQELTNAIHRLPELVSAKEGIPLTLPPGRMTREAYILKTWGENRGSVDFHQWPVSWTMEAIMAASKDSAATPGNALRSLVVFSEGWAGNSPSDPLEKRSVFWATTTTVSDAADLAISLGIAVYPVVLDTDLYRSAQARVGHGPSVSQIEDLEPVSWSLISMAKYGKLGELTGGKAFYPPRINVPLVSQILEGIRSASLSQYVVGFTPPASSRKRTHQLEVRLKSKSSGKLAGGKRTAIY